MQFSPPSLRLLTQSSFHYFQVAEAQLCRDTGRTQLPAIQARLLQCIYLCSRSRIQQCWSIFTVTVGLIFTMGLQRKCRASETGDMIEVESQKRTFWFAYTFDKHLSSSIGRPSLIRDDDVDQELPCLVDDASLSSTGLMTVHDEIQSPMKATVFSIKYVIPLRRLITR